MPNLEEKDFHPERNDDEWRQNVEGLLKQGYGRFRFQKVNGDIRTMYCTLLPSVLPESENSELTGQSKPGLLVTYDTEKEGWRSLRYDSVLNFTFLGNSPTDREQTSTWTQVTE